MEKALIKIISCHEDPDGVSEKEVYDVTAVGTFRQEEGVINVTYESVVESEGVVLKEELVLKDDYMEILRPGLGNTRMCFEQGCVTEYESRTPYGSIFMQIHTQALHIQEDEQGIRVDLSYYLSNEGQIFTKCTMNISISKI